LWCRDLGRPVEKEREPCADIEGGSPQGIGEIKFCWTSKVTPSPNIADVKKVGFLASQCRLQSRGKEECVEKSSGTWAYKEWMGSNVSKENVARSVYFRGELQARSLQWIRKKTMGGTARASETEKKENSSLMKSKVHHPIAQGEKKET